MFKIFSTRNLFAKLYKKFGIKNLYSTFQSRLRSENDHTKANLNLDQEILETDILLQEINLNTRSDLMESKRTNEARYKALEELIYLYLENNEFLKAKSVIEKMYLIKVKVYGKININITDILLLRAKINFHLNEFSLAYRDVYETIRIKKNVQALGVICNYTEEVQLCEFLQAFVEYLDKFELDENELKYLKIEKKDSITDIMKKTKIEEIEAVLLNKMKNFNKDLNSKTNDYDEIEKLLPLDFLLNRRVGLLYENKKDFEKATKHYKKAHQISVELYGKNSTIVGSILSDLSSTLYSLGTK
jgi:tetratricopeptide (TPR) repeat protein